MYIYKYMMSFKIYSKFEDHWTGVNGKNKQEKNFVQRSGWSLFFPPKLATKLFEETEDSISFFVPTEYILFF